MDVLEEINSILLKIALKIEIAVEIIIYISEIQNLKVNDFISLIEIQENRNLLQSTDI